MIIACDWADSINKRYAAEDLAVFERWIDTYVTNWAACDTLCNHPVGTLVTMYPEQIATPEKLDAFRKPLEAPRRRRSPHASRV